MTLAEEGYEVTTVSNGPGALLELQRGRALDLLLTDIRLPGNVDGWAIANRARELMPDLPVLYVSGDSAEDWATKGVPGSNMLRKPFNLDAALSAVRQALS